MAQSTGAFGANDFDVEISTNGTVWTNISGSSTKVSGLEQERMTGEAYTADGDVAVITSGKRQPIEPTVDTLYTETSGEAFETIRPLYEAGTKVYVRISPKGIGTAGAFVYTTGNASGAAAPVPITKFQYFEADAGTGDPAMGSFSFKAPCLLKTTAATSTGLGS